MRVAVFTDNDFDKVNGVTTTWRAVLSLTTEFSDARIYTASDCPVETPDYFAAGAFGCRMPWYPDMRVYLPRLRRFARELRRDRIDAIHVVTPGPVGLAGRWLARHLGLPLVGSYHTHLGEYVKALSGSTQMGRAFDVYMRWFYQPCMSVLVPTETTRAQLVARGYREEQLRIWARGVDTETFAPARASEDLRRSWRVDHRRPVIVYTGRLSAEKGLSMIAPLQRQLHRHAVAHRFVFIGDGPMKAALQRECPDGVFLGTMPHREVGIPMASGDLFLFPSTTDTFGNVVLEAQASGLPVLVSDRGGPQELVDAGVTGYVCRSDDAAAFAEAAIPLLRDAGRRAVMSQAARALSMDRRWSEAVRPLFGAWQDARHIREAPSRLPPRAASYPRATGDGR